MKKDKFVTVEIRESSGQFQKVSDVVMENVGHERMGFCEACGHAIENHMGIYHQSTGYMYVGKCCAKILVDSEKAIIAPETGTQYQYNGKNQIVVSEDFVRSIGNKIYRISEVIDRFGEKWIPSLENHYSGAWYTSFHSSFTSSILETAIESKKFDGFYHMSVKQYEAIKKALAL